MRSYNLLTWMDAAQTTDIWAKLSHVQTPGARLCLSVCQQDKSESYGRIFLKFSGNVGNGKNCK